MSVKPGLGGKGAVYSMERKPHPESHFEPNEMRIEKNDDGSFSVKKHKRLKKKFDNSEMFHGSYREPETGSAANLKEVTEHVKSHFGGAKKVAPPAAAGEPDADEMDESEEA